MGLLPSERKMLMSQYSSQHRFLTRIAVGSLLVTTLATPSQAALTSYTNVGNGIWGVDLNWSNGVPDSAGDIAFVGSSVNAENSNVSLNKNIALDGLLITDGMSVNTNGFSLAVWEPIPAAGLKIIGSNTVGNTTHHSRLIIPPIAAEGNFLTTVPFKDASLEDGGQIILEGGAIWSTGSVTIDEDSGIYGSGVIVFNSHDEFDNNGTIEVEEDGEIVIQSLHDDFYFNLDGTDRTGSLSALAPNATLAIKYDPTWIIYDGPLDIGPGSTIDFEKDLLYGVAGPGTITMNSTAFQTATLKVGDGSKIDYAGGSDLNTVGNCLIDGRFNIAGDTASINVGAEHAGRLTINDDVRFLGGVVNAAGHFLITGDVTESANTTFNLQGGEFEAPNGSMINLAGPDTNDHLSGHGLWTAGINNETRIRASEGTLTVDSTNCPVDWDGTTDEGRLEVRDGNLILIQPSFTANFASYAIVGNGNTLTLDAPTWNFSPESQIVLGGDINQGGIITATGELDIRGKVSVSMPSTIASPTTFHATSKMALDNTDLLLKGGQFEIKQGASIDGNGMLKTAHGSTLNIDVINNITPGLSNDGSLTLNGNAAGKLAMSGPFLPAGDNGVGRVVFDIKSRPNNNNFDHIQVWNTVDLDGGILRVDFDVPDAQIGDEWKIISADSITGTFGHYEFGGLPADTGLRTLVASDGVYLKLVPDTLSYLEWANQQGLLLPDLAMDADPDGDDIDNIAEMYYGGDPLEQDHHLQPAVGLTSVEGQTYLTLRVYRAIHSEIGNGIIMQVQESFGLKNWQFAQAILMSTVYDPGLCRNVLTYRSKTPITDHQRQFLRASFLIL